MNETHTPATEQSELCELSIPVGSGNVGILAPPPEEETGSRLSCWWGLTTSAIALSRHLATVENPACKSVIELGCGLGLAGVTAAKVGARVLFTDYVEQALVFARRNCELNRIRPRDVDFRTLDWEKPGTLPSVDMVLGSEVLYDYFFHGSLSRIIKKIVKSDGSVILADRKRLVVSRFIGRLIDSGFSCAETKIRVDLDGFPGQEISIFTLKPQ